MKYLLLLGIVLAVLWWARSRAPRRPRPPATPGSAAPQAMVACAHCGVHLPRAEAVVGAKGLYCGDAHRLARGDGA